jgi:hypothetical protein
MRKGRHHVDVEKVLILEIKQTINMKTIITGFYAFFQIVCSLKNVLSVFNKTGNF